MSTTLMGTLTHDRETERREHKKSLSWPDQKCMRQTPPCLKRFLDESSYKHTYNTAVLSFEDCCTQLTLSHDFHWIRLRDGRWGEGRTKSWRDYRYTSGRGTRKNQVTLCVEMSEYWSFSPCKENTHLHHVYCTFTDHIMAKKKNALGIFSRVASVMRLHFWLHHELRKQRTGTPKFSFSRLYPLHRMSKSRMCGFRWLTKLRNNKSNRTHYR